MNDDYGRERACVRFGVGLAVFLMLLAVILLSGCGGGGGVSGGGAPPSVSLVSASSPPPVTPPAASEPVAAKPAGACSTDYWGDSIAGITAPDLDPAIHAAAPHFVIGGTAQAALPQFLQAPLAPFVAIEYGTNEANGQTPLEPALRSMLDRVKALGDRAVLTGMPQTTAGDPIYHLSYNTLIQSLAKEYGAVYADWPGVSYSPGDLQPDGVHPGAAYAQRLADALSAVILENCAK